MTVTVPDCMSNVQKWYLSCQNVATHLPELAWCWWQAPQFCCLGLLLCGGSIVAHGGQKPLVAQNRLRRARGWVCTMSEHQACSEAFTPAGE